MFKTGGREGVKQIPGTPSKSVTADGDPVWHFFF